MKKILTIVSLFCSMALVAQTPYTPNDNLSGVKIVANVSNTVMTITGPDLIKGVVSKAKHSLDSSVTKALLDNLTTGLAGKAATIHSHVPADVTGLNSAIDARIPAAETGATIKAKLGVTTLSGPNTGDQVLSDATLSTTDITTNNLSTTKHGFAPKAPNDATQFLNGLGAWSVPPGGGGAATAIPPDYLITISGTTTTATPKTGSGLSSFSGTVAATVVNSAIAALTTGGSIFVTKGNYTITTPIIDNGVSNITITGQQGAKLIAGNALNESPIHITDVNNWTFNNIEIDGNAVNQATPTYNTAFSNGIWIHSSNNTIVNNPNIYNVRTTGVYVDGFSQNTGVLGGLIHDCGWNGATVAENGNGKDLFVIGVHIYNCSDCGASTYGVRCRIINNIIHDITTNTGYNSSHWGIAIEQTDSSGHDNIIKGNTIYNMWNGINVGAKCNGNIIDGNFIYDWDLSNEFRPAIWIYSNRNVIINNTCKKATGNQGGINVVGTSSYNLIQGNYVEALYGYSTDNTASYNTFMNNYGVARGYSVSINTVGCVGNKVVYNDLIQNAWGLDNKGTNTILTGNF